jgi:hypothetical protein
MQSEIMRARIACNPTFETSELRAIQHSVQPDCVQLSMGKHALESVVVVDVVMVRVLLLLLLLLVLLL